MAPKKARALRLLQATPLDGGPFQIEHVLSGAEAPERHPADAVLDIRWNEHRERFAVEFTTETTPNDLRLAAQRARRAAPASVHAMVMAPYLDEAMLDALARHHVS